MAASGRVQLSMFVLVVIVIISATRSHISAQDEANIYDRPPRISGLTEIVYPSLLHEPIPTYPLYNNLLWHLSEWNPDDPDPPTVFHETLQHFNFSDPIEQKAALKFRQAELPFKLYGVPNVDEVVRKWTNDYLVKEMERDKRINTLTSQNNHFQYWKISKEGYRSNIAKDRPTGSVKMPFSSWLELVLAADRDKLRPEQPHYYFRKNAPANDKLDSFVGRDLTIFSTKENNFFVSDVTQNKGIQCRFGMRGIIAESHWDSGRNMVAVLKGRKRYILNPPRACQRLGVNVDSQHPSFRHSMVDWSDLGEAKRHNFDRAESIETIMNAGEILYIPSYWFHYPISLEYNIQCNSRSGVPKGGDGKDEIKKCLSKGSNYKAALNMVLNK